MKAEDIKMNDMTEEKADVYIKIVGPGLVVNSPGIVVKEALESLGFSVQCEDWDGLDQAHCRTMSAISDYRERNQMMKIQIKVVACPWGG